MKRLSSLAMLFLMAAVPATAGDGDVLSAEDLAVADKALQGRRVRAELLMLEPGPPMKGVFGCGGQDAMFMFRPPDDTERTIKVESVVYSACFNGSDVLAAGRHERGDRVVVEGVVKVKGPRAARRIALRDASIVE